MDSGGEQRFAQWSASHAPALHRFAFLLCGDWHEAEDLVQEALARTALHWRRVERVENPTAYVRTILLNQCRSMWRRPWARRTHMVAVDTPIPDGSDALAVRDELMAALRALPVRQRAAVVLRYYEDMSEAETASALGCSVGTVKSQTHKAMQSLRRSLGKEGLHADR